MKFDRFKNNFSIVHTFKVAGGRKSLTCLLIFLLSICFSPSFAESESHDYQLKAVLIHQIVNLVLWPPGTHVDSEEPFNLYVLGEDRFGKAFDTIAGRIVHNKSMVVHKARALEDIPADCHAVFVDIPDRKELCHVLERVAGMPILTISDEPGFAEMGGMIGLIDVDKRIRFTTNIQTTREAGLCISSNLIKLSASIQGEIK